MTISSSRSKECTQARVDRASLKMLERNSLTECWLTVLANPDVSPSESAAELFAHVGRELTKYNIQPIQEKVYGTIDAREQIQAQRLASYRESGLDACLPFTYLQGQPVGNGSLGGVQLWGIIPQPGAQVQVLTTQQCPCTPARLVSGIGYRMLYLPAIAGTDAEGQLPHTVSEQAERMFINAEAALKANDMSFVDVVRTWIYLADILSWYGEFNRVRTTFYKERGIGKFGQSFPASTGIQARTGGEACIMDVLAVKAQAGSVLEVRPLLASSRQDMAFKYGSAFSRGMSVLMEGQQTVLISGTASIGPDGKTRYLDAPEAQIMETLLSIAALLESVGGGLKDICSATLFLKDPTIFKTFKDITRLLGVSDFPVVPVVADVCRPELLVEIEAVAVMPASKDKLSPGTDGPGRNL